MLFIIRIRVTNDKSYFKGTIQLGSVKWTKKKARTTVKTNWWWNQIQTKPPKRTSSGKSTQSSTQFRKRMEAKWVQKVVRIVNHCLDFNQPRYKTNQSYSTILLQMAMIPAHLQNGGCWEKLDGHATAATSTVTPIIRSTVGGGRLSTSGCHNQHSWSRKTVERCFRIIISSD